MLTLNITNTSGTAIAAGDGVLPNALGWFDLADTANIDVVIQVGDLARVEDNHSGFTLGELLQGLKQRGICTYNVTDLGDSEDTGSVPDHAVATAA